MMKFFALW